MPVGAGLGGIRADGFVGFEVLVALDVQAEFDAYGARIRHILALCVPESLRLMLPKPLFTGSSK
jgi:hypothetical protein